MAHPVHLMLTRLVLQSQMVQSEDYFRREQAIWWQSAALLSATGVKEMEEPSRTDCRHTPGKLRQQCLGHDAPKTYRFVVQHAVRVLLP